MVRDCYCRYKDTKVLIHVFTDGSSKVVYLAAAYLSVTDIKENETVNLVASRRRLAPPDGDTIPRLELIGARLTGSSTSKLAEIRLQSRARDSRLIPLDGFQCCSCME